MQPSFLKLQHLLFSYLCFFFVTMHTLMEITFLINYYAFALFLHTLPLVILCVCFCKWMYSFFQIWIIPFWQTINPFLLFNSHFLLSVSFNIHQSLILLFLAHTLCLLEIFRMWFSLHSVLILNYLFLIWFPLVVCAFFNTLIAFGLLFLFCFLK